ncbi:hypothetical protein FGO68_gene6867 [Halteria grandinella]|uniref:N-acetyltransferase domain-containing protein n=1 Tax=Halteria grandinella TaxID=5974 RepID=A0A8J8T4W2_HALGN|nr:hypothetical protein FGO68_gene6867 [Halteria grandinella]
MGSTDYQILDSLFLCFKDQFIDLMGLQIGAFCNGKLLGACLNNDLYSKVPLNHPFSDLNLPLIKATYSVQVTLEASGIIHQGESGRYFQNLFVTIDPSLKSKGVTPRMLEMVTQLAQQAGFKQSYIECTNQAMLRVGVKCGFQNMGEFRYDEYEDENGKKIFAKVGKEYGGACTMLIKRYL